MEMNVRFYCKYRRKVCINYIVAFFSDKIIKYCYLIPYVLSKLFIIGFEFLKVK